MGTRKLSQDSQEISRRINLLWKATKDGLGLTQTKAANQLGLSQSAFNQILSGSIAVNSVMVLGITSLLNADLQKLCEGLKEYEHLNKIRPVVGCMLPVTITITGKMVTNKSIQSMQAIEGGFAVEIDSEEYSPRYNIGDYAVVNPSKGLEKGDQVFLQFKNKDCLIRVVDTILDNGSFTAHHPSKPGPSAHFSTSDEKLAVMGVILGVTFG